MSYFNIVAQSSESTVVTNNSRRQALGWYQSEADLERSSSVCLAVGL